MKGKRDGRYIDTSLATLEGEASHQRTSPDGKTPAPTEAWHIVPSASGAGLEPTYYDEPPIKQPVWVWSIPTYFYVGGVSGAAMVMGMAAQLLGGPKLRRFDERCRWIGAIGGGIGSALLVYDLGRKARFLFMLRVFRPTSPMSVGSWVLAAAMPLSAGSALLTMSEGWLRRVGDAAGLGAGLLGMPLATYTAVLLSNTAVPVWSASRRTLPLLFGASSMASLGAVCAMLPLDAVESRITARFGLAGRVAELASGMAVERETGRVERAARPLHQGPSGALWKASRALTVASLALTLLPGRWRGKQAGAGALAALGGLALRWAVFQAGKASARDPRATFRQQRAGFGGAEVTGRPAVAEPPRALPQPVPFRDYIKV